MPFTFSHPAIVLPLTKARLKLSATGLIVGSIIPDFEYFIRMTDLTRYSHTLNGIFWFDLPLALAVSFIYHLIVRNALFDNLPSFLKDRFYVYRKFDWSGYFLRNWALVLLSIVIGAASHIVWDAVTHNTMFYVTQADLTMIMKIGRINLAGYKFLQMISSIAGGLAVILSIFALRRIHQPKTKINYWYWVSVSFITVFVFFLRFSRHGFHFYYLKYHRVVGVTLIASIMISLILTPLLLNQKQPPGAKNSLQKKKEVDTVTGS
jgi:hypothetical protein